MSRYKVLTRYLLSVVLAGAFSIDAMAQDDASDQDAEITVLEAVPVIGSRRATRSASESSAPVDIVNRETLTTQRSIDLDSQIARVVPSYNVDDQAINDAATLVRPASLRGLPPDIARQ